MSNITVTWLASVASLAVIVLLHFRLLRHEKSRGRFDSFKMPNRPDPALFDEHLFDLRPEEAGALWDRRIGPSEVVAVIARPIVEGKLASTVRGKGLRRVLSLTLIANRKHLRGYERTLIDKLFFRNRLETDTTTIQKHFKPTGFDPVAIIREPITQRLSSRKSVGMKEEPPADRWPLYLPFLLLLLIGLEATGRGIHALEVPAVLLAVSTLPMIIGSVFTFVYRAKIRHLSLTSTGILLPAIALLAVNMKPESVLDIPDFDPSMPGRLALALFPVWCMSVWTKLARTHESAVSMERRQRIAAIRQHFQTELSKADPALDDTWLPYLLALGLEDQVDRWRRLHGAGATEAPLAGSETTQGSAAGHDESTHTWTGGGGLFGSRDEIGGWSAAARRLAVGVAKPRSPGKIVIPSGYR